MNLRELQDEATEARLVAEYLAVHFPGAAAPPVEDSPPPEPGQEPTKDEAFDHYMQAAFPQLTPPEAKPAPSRPAPWTL